MEAEIINMTANLFNCSEVNGFVTSGGTESIMIGIFANK